MVSRIKELAAHFDLSPTAFADRIEVARPVISHIFSERNRPSLEVVQKIGATFPEVNLDWLLYGKGEMLKNIVPSVGQPAETLQEEKESAAQNNKPLNKNNAIGSLHEEVSNFEPKSTSKIIRKVLLFYSDNTFEEFNPS